jgi:DNA-binding MarR family transcriptional regulator
MPDRGPDLPTAYRLLVADVYDLAGRSRRTSEALARAEGQTTARWHLMSVISDDPTSVAGAARRLGLARQSVQRVADQLVADGLAEASPDPADARAPRLALTPAGRRVLDRLVERADRQRDAQLSAAGLTARELEEARRVLRAVGSALTGEPGR